MLAGRGFRFEKGNELREHFLLVSYTPCSARSRRSSKTAQAPASHAGTSARCAICSQGASCSETNWQAQATASLAELTPCSTASAKISASSLCKGRARVLVSARFRRLRSPGTRGSMSAPAAYRSQRPGHRARQHSGACGFECPFLQLRAMLAASSPGGAFLEKPVAGGRRS